MVFWRQSKHPKMVEAPQKKPSPCESQFNETKAPDLHRVVFASRHDLLTAPNLWQASESFGMRRWKEERNQNENDHNNHTLRTFGIGFRTAELWLEFRNKKIRKGDLFHQATERVG